MSWISASPSAPIAAAPFMCQCGPRQLGRHWTPVAMTVHVTLAVLASSVLIAMGVLGGRWASSAGRTAGSGVVPDDRGEVPDGAQEVLLVRVSGDVPFTAVVGWAFWGWLAVTGLCLVNVALGGLVCGL